MQDEKIAKLEAELKDARGELKMLYGTISLSVAIAGICSATEGLDTMQGSMFLLGALTGAAKANN